VQAANRRNLTFTGVGVTEELPLLPNLGGPRELLISTIHPKRRQRVLFPRRCRGRSGHRRNAALWVDERHFRLDSGDSFAFASTEAHRCANDGDEPVKVLWVITPPHY
jgi:hypothetical protein